VVVTACAPLGLVRVAVGAADVGASVAGVDRLRAFVAADGGSLVVERGSTALRTRVDPWGPVPPPALALMRGLKQEFDPDRTLNPGRFVAGL
jgi:glycolate oxidase FAD binding subunit